MNKVYLIGNAHLDPVWLWRWQEGYSEVLSTFRSALDRISEFDGFIFTCAGAAYYQWVEESDPLMFEEIRKRVAEGRWVIVGGWWIQPDCNAPSGEAFARHALYSQRYFKEKFGVTARVGYNVDSFGHNAMIPQLLKNAKMDSYVFMRPSPKEMEYPFSEDTFLWRSPDGSEVPAFRILESYCENNFENLEPKVLKHMSRAEETSMPLMCFYGVGNHGGGPTIKNLETLNALVDEKGSDALKLSSPNEYFADLKTQKLNVLEGDVQNHAVGCFSSVMKIKELNHLCEAKLYSAEMFNTAAVQLGLCKKESLDEAWKQVMFNQFHDIMGGCCMRAAVDDAVKAYGYSATAADLTENRALQKIAWNIDTSKGLTVVNERHNTNVRHAERIWERDDLGVPVVLFNPLPFEVTEPVNLGFDYASVTDDNGNEIPLQSVRSTITNCDFGKRESRIVATIPPTGWRLFWCYGKTESRAEVKGMLKVSDQALENDWIRVSLTDGYITSVFDKKNSRELLCGKVEALVLDEKHCDTWAHDVTYFDKVIGSFEMQKADIVEQGDVCAVLRIKACYNKSELEIFITLYRDLPEVFTEYRVNWQEQHKMLKIQFPTVFKESESVNGIPYGFLNRKADGTERPMQNFVCVKEQGVGFGISTDSRTAFDLKDGKLRITALRSPIFSDHYGWRDDRCEFTEQGEHRFMLNLMPFNGDLTEIYNSASRLISPVRSISTTYHKGRLKSEGSAVFADKGNIRITAFKTAEDNDGYILRCHETAGVETKAEITLAILGKSFKADFGCQEIKTFRINENGITETDFLEY